MENGNNNHLFKMNCSVKFILLVLLIIVNLVLFINLFPDLFKKVVIGSFILTANIIIRREENDTQNDKHWSTLFIIFLIACTTIVVITITIAFLCVILKNHKRALYLLYACVTTSLVFEMMVFIYIFNNLNYDPKNIIADWLDNSIHDYKKPDCGYIKIIWDYLQPTFKCCGYRSPYDWTHLNKNNVTDHGYNYVPESCCIKYPCGVGSYDNQTSYWVGCGHKILYITVVAEIIGWAFGVLAITKVTAILLANCYTTHTEKTSLILPTIQVYKIDNKSRNIRKRQNTNDILRTDVIRSSVKYK